ncbi:MAG: hypothetical protein AAB922_05415, partial [Patescibacteria group bacterium]
MQNIYGGSADNNIAYLSPPTTNAEQPAVGGGYGTNTQGDVVTIIQTPLLDFGSPSTKVITGTQLLINSPLITSANPFIDGRFLDSDIVQSSQLLNTVGSTTPILTTLSLDGTQYNPALREPTYRYHNRFTTFTQSTFMFQWATRTESLDLNKWRFRITNHESP